MINGEWASDVMEMISCRVVLRRFWRVMDMRHGVRGQWCNVQYSTRAAVRANPQRGSRYNVVRRIICVTMRAVVDSTAVGGYPLGK